MLSSLFFFLKTFVCLCFSRYPPPIMHPALILQTRQKLINLMWNVDKSPHSWFKMPTIRQKKILNDDSVQFAI